MGFVSQITSRRLAFIGCLECCLIAAPLTAQQEDLRLWCQLSPILGPGKAVEEKCVKVSNIVRPIICFLVQKWNVDWSKVWPMLIKITKKKNQNPKEQTEGHLTKINLGLRQHNLRNLKDVFALFQFSYSDRGIYRSGNTVFSWHVLAPEWTSVCYIFLPPPPSCSMLKHLRGAWKSTLHSCNLGNRL